jgi:O-antigen ligase
MGLSMPTPRHVKAGALLGPVLAGLVTFAVWRGLALAVGMRGRLALAIAVLAGAYALACTAFIAFADLLREDTEADGDLLGVPASEPRQGYLLRERRVSSGG